jgi:hypothetical protein
VSEFLSFDGVEGVLLLLTDVELRIVVDAAAAAAVLLLLVRRAFVVTAAVTSAVGIERILAFLPGVKRDE